MHWLTPSTRLTLLPSGLPTHPLQTVYRRFSSGSYASCTAADGEKGQCTTADANEAEQQADRIPACWAPEAAAAAEPVLPATLTRPRHRRSSSVMLC